LRGGADSGGGSGAALILGIICVVASFTPFPYWFYGILGILGISGLILGFIGRDRAKRGEATNGMVALWGIITSAAVVVPIDRQPCDPLLELECGDHGGGRPVVVGAASPAAENTVSRRWRPPCPAISVWTGVVGPVSAGWKSSCCISWGRCRWKRNWWFLRSLLTNRRALPLSHDLSRCVGDDVRRCRRPVNLLGQGLALHAMPARRMT
jgi:hypothetical protein